MSTQSPLFLLFFLFSTNCDLVPLDFHAVLPTLLAFCLIIIHFPAIYPPKTPPVTYTIVQFSRAETAHLLSNMSLHRIS